MQAPMYARVTTDTFVPLDARALMKEIRDARSVACRMLLLAQPGIAGDRRIPRGRCA